MYHLPSYLLLTTTTLFHFFTPPTLLYHIPNHTAILTTSSHKQTNSTPRMDEPSSDCTNPAKRRCPNDRESDTLFMSRSPDSTTPKKPPTTEGTLNEDEDEAEDDELGSEPDEPMYDESQELFPAHPAFDPAVEDVRARAEASVKRLDSLLEPYASVNKDLGNMKAKSAEVMKTKAPRQIRVGLLGGTGAGKCTCSPVFANVLTRSRQERSYQFSYRQS
jgi:hypothetical protein